MNSRSDRSMARSSSVRPSPSNFGGVRQEGTSHTEVVEGDVGQGDVGFEIRSRCHPLREPLSNDEVVIGVIENLARKADSGSRHGRA